MREASEVVVEEEEGEVVVVDEEVVDEEDASPVVVEEEEEEVDALAVEVEGEELFATLRVINAVVDQKKKKKGTQKLKPEHNKVNNFLIYNS